MSGVTGAERIRSREDYRQFLASYEKIISKFPGFVSIQPSGSYNSNLSKESFGDIDLITHLKSSKDKSTLKKELVDFLLKIPNTVIVPFESEKYKGKRVYNSGEIISIRYHDKSLGYSVQIDNIIALDKTEANFKQKFLDWPAEKQGLILGLVKVATVETDPKLLFRKLGITTNVEIKDNQEWEFNLSSSELQLRLVTYKPNTYEQLNREVIWRSKNFNDIQKLLFQFDLALDFDNLMELAHSILKNKRSKIRIAGVFSSMISVKTGEIGTEKGETKQTAINTIVKKFMNEEVENKKAVITYGRFNPPTKGHELLINKVIELAKQKGAEAKVYTSRTQNKNNPLSYEDKIHFLTKWFGSIIVDDIGRENRTVFEVLTNLGNRGYSDVTLVVGSDRVKEFDGIIKPYLNTGKETSINIKNFKVVSAGERDPDDNESISGISGTKMRQFVRHNDPKSFHNGVPSKATISDTTELWSLLRKAIVESLSFREYLYEI